MKTLTVVAPDRPGLLADITEVLSHNQIDIRSFETHLEQEHACIKLALSDYDRGLGVLNEAGYQAITEESVLIRIDDRPGALARIARTLSEHQIDIRSLTLVQPGQASWAVAISSSDNERVREILSSDLIS